MPVILPPPPITSRPTDPRYRATDNGSETPDKILTAADGTQYLCYKMNVQGNVYVKKRCWRIRRVSTIASGLTGIVEETTFEYPFGLDAYNFELSDVLNYPYEIKW